MKEEAGGGQRRSLLARLRSLGKRGRGSGVRERTRPGSPGRPDVAGTQRRLVLLHDPRRPAAPDAGVAATAAASKAALLGCAAAPTSSHPHTERDNKQSLRCCGRLPLVRHNTAHTHSHTREGRRGGRPAVSQRLIAQSGPCRRSLSANPKIPSPLRGGTRGGNVIAGSNRREDLGFLFVCFVFLVCIPM